MDIIAELAKTLGSFRAENLGDRMFSLYTKPAYFPELLTPIPCMLQGGRGTGKTTVLKCLSYEGQYRLANENFIEFNKQNYIGLYYKLETGLVNAFYGANKEEAFWQRIFSHFMNLQLCKLLCDFAIWYEEKQQRALTLNPHQFKAFCVSIGLDGQPNLMHVRDQLDLAIASLEYDVNYASDSESTKHSPIGAPTRRFVNLLRSTPELNAKTFYFLLDEYENLREYQQTILNTFIKQADSEITFKIGIRELGLKTRHTLNPNEKLVDPADLVLIDISDRLGDREFDEFSRSVFEHRFEELQSKGINIELNISELLENFSEEDEAIKLGAEKVAEEVRTTLLKALSTNEVEKIGLFNSRDLALMKFLSVSQADDLGNIFKNAISDATSWRNKVNNYGYASLFALRKKKVGITKYYCGWNTFLSLSAGNIRYLLQLVTNSMIAHAKGGYELTKKISAKCQTEVAAEVGKKNLLELEGLSTRGAQLMKLVLGLGQVLHEMAIQAEGHAPEVTQFEISLKQLPSNEVMSQVDELLNAAVMHLAILRTSGTKLGGPGDTRDFDYMLHPIFSPFFVYSHRRKRKFLISPEDLLGIVSNPSDTIKTLLTKQNRVASVDIPEQLRLFGGFYEGNS